MPSSRVTMVFRPSLTETSQAFTARGPISQARTQVMWAPRLSHSGLSNTTRVESVQAEMMSAPRTTSSGRSIAVTLRPRVSLISAA